MPKKSQVKYVPVASESAIVELLMKGRVGRARIRWHDSRIWEIDFGRVMTGVRMRYYRMSATTAYRLAIEKTEELKRHGQLARALTTGERWMAAEAIKICKRLGVTVLDVVREFEKTHPHGANARTLDEVRLELVASKKKMGRSGRHVDSLDYRLRSLVKAIGNQPVTAITTKCLQQELDRHRNWNPTTMHSAVQGWKIAFNFAIKHGYLLNNPANALDLPKIIHDEPTIFSVADVRRLMAATLFRDRHPLVPACRAYLAIGMFAGLRPEEIERLEWKHVDLETATIRVKASNAKDRDRRIVEMPPNLVAWLRPLVRARGKVLTHPVAKLRAAARTILGLTEWPADIMRHTFVSYHFGEFQNEAYTKKQVGHRDDGRVFYNHYMVPVSRPNARLFWATIPPVALIEEVSSWSAVAMAA